MPYIYHKNLRTILVFLVYFIFFTSLSQGKAEFSVSPSQNVLVNQSITLECSFTTGAPGVGFTLPGNLGCVTDYLTCSCMVAISTDCPDNRTYRLVLIVQASWNNGVTYCENAFGGNRSDIFTMNVTTPVTSVTLAAVKVNVDAGDQITLTCQTSSCYPKASIRWYKESVDITSYASKTDIGSNLVRTTSTLRYRVMSQDNKRLVYCSASNFQGNKVNSTTHRLDVRNPPSSSPVITASPPGLQYDTGTRVTLTCQIPGGNPTATLSWRCKNTDMVGTNQSTSTTAVSVLSLVMDSSYNNQQCTCTATHRLLTSPKSTSVTLTVFYNNVIISNWNQTYSKKEQDQFQLDCEVDGKPLSNITWVFVRNNTIIERNYHVSKSSVDISSLNCLDYGTYRVIADNGKGPHASKTTKLLVKCKPRLYTTGSLTPVKLGIGKNESLRIFVRILLFPPAIKTTWNLSRTINESRVIRNSTDGYKIDLVKGDVEQNITLYKESVNTEDFGNYTLRVENEMGVFTSIYHVDSARPPLLPTNLTVLCENSLAIKLSWISNFNGGDDQKFTISYSTDLKESFNVLKRNIRDEGYGKSHSYIPTTELQGVLWFTITASNKFGTTISDAIYCNALKISAKSSKESSIGGIIGGTFGGVVLIILIVLIFLNRKYQIKCHERMPNPRCRKCRLCENAKRKGIQPIDHDCRKNWDGSAKAMEPDMIVGMLKDLEKDHIHPHELVMDDDSTTNSRARKECEQSITKFSDRNHLKKTFSNKLYDLQRFKKYQQLRGKTMTHLKKCFSYVLAQNQKKPEELKKSLLCIIPHMYGDHLACPSWCKYKRNPASYLPRNLPYSRYLTCPELKKDLEAIIQTYAQQADKLSDLGSTQACESFNHIVASKNPKSLFLSGSESTSFRIAAAVAQKNIGKSYIQEVSIFE